MATLKAVLEKLDELPEAQHPLYAHDEKANKFFLDLEGIEEHPSTSALRNALESQKAARKKAGEEIQRLKDRLAKVPDNFDPAENERLRTEIATLQAKIEEYEQDPKYQNKEIGDKERQEAVAARRMLEQKITGIEKAHAAEIDKRDKKIKQKDDFIAKLLVNEGLTKALVEAGVSKEYLKAAMALLAPNVKVTEDEDGDYSALVESDTGPLEIPRFVQDWVASDEGKPFVPPAKGADAGAGGGPKKPALGGDVKNPWAKETWNLTTQGQLVRTNRPLAEKLAKAAGHKIQPAA